MRAIARQCCPPILWPYLQPLGEPFRRRRDPREVALQRTFNALNVNALGDELILREGLVLRIHPDLRMPFEAFCWRFPEMVEEMNVFIARTGGRRKLLDVGAYHGVFSLAFATQAADRSVLSVDPSPLAYAPLLYNIRKNELMAQVVSVECALSNEGGALPMFYEWQHAVAAPLDPESDSTIMVEAITGDRLCERMGFVPDVIKIDVEGHEVKVVRGLAGTIRKAKPLVFVELHPARINREGDRLIDLLDFFEREGYEAQSLSTQRGFDKFATATTDTRAIFEYRV